MRKNKILYKLFAVFAAVLLLFICIVDMLFSFLFNNQTIAMRQHELLGKATQLATVLPPLLEQDNANVAPTCHNRSQLQSYIEFLQKSDNCTIWLLNCQSQIIAPLSHNSLHLAAADEQLIKSALQGQASVTSQQAAFFTMPAITAVAPLRTQTGQYLGVILLQTANTGISNTTLYGIKLLIFCSCLAFLIALTAAWLLSYSFTDPLRRLRQMALAISDGNYLVKSNVQRNDEFGELADKLDLMAQRLEAASNKKMQTERARRLFIANVSHELRTPVAVLRASLEALAAGLIKTPAQQAEYYQQMLQETRYLERLVNDMLELAKLQNPDFLIEKAAFILNDLVNDAARAMRQYALSKTISIETDLPPKPVECFGDYGRLRQMLIIVLDNAIKFSPPGQNIAFNLFREQDSWKIKITDHGDGIDPDVLPDLFNRFHKVNNERNKQGTGLGLAIAKEIAQRHSIQIVVESRRHAGSSFIFIFPQQK